MEYPENAFEEYLDNVSIETQALILEKIKDENFFNEFELSMEITSQLIFSATVKNTSEIMEETYIHLFNTFVERWNTWDKTTQEMCLFYIKNPQVAKEIALVSHLSHKICLEGVEYLQEQLATALNVPIFKRRHLTLVK